MGKQDADFADDMIKEVGSRIRDSHGLDSSEIEWKSVWWAPVLTTAEAEMWRRLKDKNDLDYHKLRKFVLHSLGDAVAYRKVDPEKLAPGENPTYQRIHDLVQDNIRILRDRVRAGKPANAKEVPLVVVAHSLGCHIMSNYIWDLQKPGATSLGNDFEDMKTLSGLLTFGCNIPLFTLAYENVQSINFPVNVKKYFPKATKPNAIAAATKWWNYYDPDDILGWPLKPLSASYRSAVHKDVPINAGKFWSSWNPLSHSGYWEDNDFTVPAAAAIAKLLRLL